MAAKSDNFLADIVKPKFRGLTVGDGIRFGLGFIIGQLIIALLIGGAVYALIITLHISVPTH
jgi:hypothetical protein